jgi:hypothetical protein
MDPFQQIGLNVNKKDMNLQKKNKDMINTVVIKIMILKNHSKINIRYITACMDGLILDHISLYACAPSPIFFFLMLFTVI